MSRTALAVAVSLLAVAPAAAQDQPILKWRDPAPVFPEAMLLPDLAKAHLGRFIRPLTPLAFSPDGKRLAVCTGDGAFFSGQLTPIYLVDVATGKVLHAYRGHKSDVSVAAFSPDGKLLATAGMDGTVRLWDTTTGKQFGDDLNLPHNANTVAFTADGKQLIVASSEIEIWDVAKQSSLRRFEVPKLQSTEFFYGALSPDGKVYASRSWERLRFFDFETGKQIREFVLKASPGGAPVFTADSKYVVDNLPPSGYQKWEVATGNTQVAPQKNRNGFDEPHYTFSADGTLRAWRAGQRNGGQYNEPATYLVAVSPLERREDTILLSTGSEVHALKISADGKTLAWGGADGSLRLFDAATGKLTHTLFEPVSPVKALYFADDGKTLRSLTLDHELHEWDLRTHKELRRAAMPLPRWTLFRTYGPGRIMDVYGKENNQLGLWDLTTGKRVADLDADVARRSAAEYFLVAGFSPRGTRLAVVANDNGFGGNLIVLDAATGKKLQTLGVEPGINAVNVSDDGRMACFGRPDYLRDGEELVVLELATGRPRAELKRKFEPRERTWLRAVHLSPDGKHLVAVRIQDASGLGPREPPPPGPPVRIELWDIAAGKLVESLPANGPAVAFSPDGGRLAMMSSHKVVIYDVKARIGQAEHGHWKTVTSLAFSPDGATLATAGDDGIVLLWDVKAFFNKQ
jgi:WD40 repeat protein